MKILMICKYPPIQGGVSAEAYWTANAFSELGHSVFVLTNANEVEEAYRTELDTKDTALLRGFRIKDAIRLHSTELDKKHIYVPQNNPSISKLVSVGIGTIEEFRPDFIYSFYVEPYGVVAMILSRLMNLPYTIRHAGSDIGRLMLTEQLHMLYHKVFCGAQAVLTSEKHHQMFKEIGVTENRFVRPVSLRLPGDIFHAEGRNPRSSIVKIGMYGKVGKAKGTQQAIEAIKVLSSQGTKLSFQAHWGGRDMFEYSTLVKASGMSLDIFQISRFIPQWKIPDFIRSRDIILFLENNFKIAFHTPGIPYEVWACGAHLVTTEEIAQKQHVKKFVNESNCTVIRDRITDKSVAKAIIRAIEKGGQEETDFDAAIQSIRSRQDTQNMLTQIGSLL